ncbi:MAG: hypothetical protein LH630_07495 [Actinomycetia bacterium]|nr:hypothetical protein [Actinomycetes bacterium]
MAERDDADDPARVEARRRFGRLPEPISADDMVESVPEPPPDEQGFDPHADAIRRFGIPL